MAFSSPGRRDVRSTDSSATSGLALATAGRVSLAGVVDYCLPIPELAAGEWRGPLHGVALEVELQRDVVLHHFALHVGADERVDVAGVRVGGVLGRGGRPQRPLYGDAFAFQSLEARRGHDALDARHAVLTRPRARALGGHGSAVQLHQAARHKQAQTQAALGAGRVARERRPDRGRPGDVREWPLLSEPLR